VRTTGPVPAQLSHRAEPHCRRPCPTWTHLLPGMLPAKASPGVQRKPPPGRKLRNLGLLENPDQHHGSWHALFLAAELKTPALFGTATCRPTCFPAQLSFVGPPVFPCQTTFLCSRGLGLSFLLTLVRVFSSNSTTLIFPMLIGALGTPGHLSTEERSPRLPPGPTGKGPTS